MAEFEDVDIIEDDSIDFTPMPTYVPGLPEAPVLNNPDPANFYKDYMMGLDDESYLAKFSSPTFSDAEIEKLYAPSDYKSDKALALMKLGLGLMQPTRGGQIGEAISVAGTNYANEIGKIKQLQRAEKSANTKGILSAKLQQRAASITDQKALYDMKRGVAMTVAEKKYDQEIASDKAALTLYNDTFKAAKAKREDYFIKGYEPIENSYVLPDGNGGFSEPFTAYSINVPDKGIQFYKPTDILDKDGLPQLQLITNPAGIREMDSAVSGTPSDYAERGAGASGLQDLMNIKGELDTFDQNILYLEDLTASVSAAPNRAGFLAGLHKYAQDMGQIGSDAMNVNFNNFFKGGNKKLEISPNTKLVLPSTTIERYISSGDMDAALAAGEINQAEVDVILEMNKSFQRAAVVGQGVLDADVTGPEGKDGGVRYDQKIWTGEGFVPAFESAEQQDLIIDKLRWFDTDLPLNEARANAIIYAIARARKSSGRLNLDDIERAAKDLNIFGMTSSASVITKLGFLQEELMSKRNSAYTSLSILAAGNPNMQSAYDEMKKLGYGSYNSDRIRGLGQANPDGTIPEGPKLSFGFENGEAVLLPN